MFSLDTRTMVDLIKGLAQVRDGLTLIAFLSLVLLVAFRTRRVPELLFVLVRDKLTRQQFALLLRRFMVLGFCAFLALVSLAALSQALGHLTASKGLTISDLRSELAKAKESEDLKTHAEAQYGAGMEKLSRHDLDGAIASLQASIQTIPTQTAEEMLIYLYRQKGDLDRAAAAWEKASKVARERGDILALARLDNGTVPHTIPSSEGDHDLIGVHAPLPTGGDTVDTAVALLPEMYRCVGSDRCKSWFKLNLREGQRLAARFRTPASQSSALTAIYDTNGGRVQQAYAEWPSQICQIDWTAKVNGSHFIQIDAAPGTVFHFQVL
jgi:hypothetical protein